jgi:TatD DNase family protein
MLIDSHCHLDFPDFEAGRADIIARAEAAGVGAMVTISTRVKRFPALIKITETYDNVFCSVGTHPHNAAEEPDVTVAELVALTAHPKVVAIGEAGLDYHYSAPSREAQRTSFLRHIDAARQTQLPLVIHARSADNDMIEILETETAKGKFPFILHCFSSGAELAKVGVALGGNVSFSGIITFKTSETLRLIASTIPHDLLLVETDAPYLAPVPHRGKTNEPSFVAHTAKVLAECAGLTVEELARITTENALRVFSKIPRSALKAA